MQPLTLIISQCPFVGALGFKMVRYGPSFIERPPQRIALGLDEGILFLDLFELRVDTISGADVPARPEKHRHTVVRSTNRHGVSLEPVMRAIGPRHQILERARLAVADARRE